MRYEAMGRNRTERLNVPQLLGGLNTATEPSLIADDELADVCNLTTDHGALVTRGAVRAIGDTPMMIGAGENALVDKILHHPITVDEELCTVVLSSVSNSAQDADVTVQVVTLSGECRHTYQMTAVQPPYHFAIAPCDKDRYGAAFLLYHRGNVYIPDETTATMRQVKEELYAPLVMINAQSILLGEGETPSIGLANGVMYEGFNTLTGRYRAQFTSSVQPQASATECYVLPTTLTNTDLTMEIVSPKGTVCVTMKVGEEAVGFQLGASHYSAQAFGEGYVKVSPALPVSTVSGNVTITCERTGIRTENGTDGASAATWFGGTQNSCGGTRLFLADRGRSLLRWSDVNDPFYFPENNYMVVGDLSQKITALEKQGDMLVIFKEREMFYTTYVQGEIDAEAVQNGTNVDVTVSQAYFPLTQLSPQIGCRCPQSIVLCRDRLVWLDEDARIYTLVTTGMYSERNVREIGQKIRPYLLEHTTAAQRVFASAVDHRGKYRVLIGKRMVEFEYNDSGFINGSERALQNTAWFAHRFDGFADKAKQTVVGDGADSALLIDTYGVSVAESMVRMPYILDTEGDDRYVYLNDQHVPVAVEQPIVSTLTTKTYELSDPAAFKRIGAFFPMMRTDGAVIRFIPDGECPVSGRWYQSEDLRAHLVVPSVKRCQTLAIRIDAEGALCVKGLRLQYTPFGTVR